MAQAVDALADMMNNADIPPQTRLAAPRMILENGFKATETMDIMERLDTLETAMKERRKT